MRPNNNAHGIKSVLQYDLPKYVENKAGAYVYFNAFDPDKGKMRRKRIKLNHIDGKMKRKAYAQDLIKRLSELLSNGWNPWTCPDTGNLQLWQEAIDNFEAYIERMYNDGSYKLETYRGYKSYIKILNEYASKTNPIYYIYQFDQKFCSKFLDFIFIERENKPQTYNNYLGFLRILSGYLLQKGYIASKPTDALKPINKRLIKKSRTDIPTEKVGEISEYLKKEDPNFLFACYLLYYCFIRPVELTRIKVSDISVKRCTITVRAECSKNKRTQSVTVPKKVMQYAISLGILSAPMQDYVFSDKLKPGKAQIDTKIFRDHWAKVKKALKLKPQWKFYSLKDTGITEMLENNMPTIDVRDQARHSSLAITDVYTRHNAEANKDIMELDGSL